MIAFDVSLEMQSNSKNYVSVQDDEVTASLYYEIGMGLTLGKFTLTSAGRDTVFIELLEKASFVPNEKMRYLFGIAKQF